MDRPESRPSSSQSQYTRPASQASSTLPETAAFYKNSIDAGRTSHSERRYRNANAMYRTSSVSSVKSRKVDGNGIDGEMAGGPAERTRVVDDDDDDRGRAASQLCKNEEDSADTSVFLPARDMRRAPGSILPSAAFFAPKRPPQAALSSTSMHSLTGPQSMISPSSTDALRSSNAVHVISAIGTDGQSITLQASKDEILTKGLARSAGTGSDRLTPSTQKPGRAVGRTPANSPKQSREKGYVLHKGANRFFCRGLIMMSDDNPLPFLLSLVLIVALPVLWFVFVAPYTWHHVSPAAVVLFAYVWAVSLSSMLVTAWRDPGVLPRDVDPDPPCTAGENGETIDVSDPLAIPLPRIIRVPHATDLKVKWCDTCGTYRPPRSSHCRVCDNCVENIDHHCTFLNTCIGRRNYFTFFAFLVFSILLCCISIAFSALHVALLTRPAPEAVTIGNRNGEGKTFQMALRATPVSAVLFLLSIGAMVPLVVLFVYHVRLVCMNRSTVEQIRINTYRSYSEKPSFDEEDGAGLHSDAPPSALIRTFARCIPFLHLGKPGRDPNPFAYTSVVRNIGASLLRPMTSESWIQRYSHAEQDIRRPNPSTLT